MFRRSVLVLPPYEEEEPIGHLLFAPPPPSLTRPITNDPSLRSDAPRSTSTLGPAPININVHLSYLQSTGQLGHNELHSDAVRQLQTDRAGRSNLEVQNAAIMNKHIGERTYRTAPPTCTRQKEIRRNLGFRRHLQVRTLPLSQSRTRTGRRNGRQFSKSRISIAHRLYVYVRMSMHACNAGAYAHKLRVGLATSDKRRPKA